MLSTDPDALPALLALAELELLPASLDVRFDVRTDGWNSTASPNDDERQWAGASMLGEWAWPSGEWSGSNVWVANDVSRDPWTVGGCTNDWYDDVRCCWMDDVSDDGKKPVCTEAPVPETDGAVGFAFGPPDDAANEFVNEPAFVFVFVLVKLLAENEPAKALDATPLLYELLTELGSL